MTASHSRAQHTAATRDGAEQQRHHERHHGHANAVHPDRADGLEHGDGAGQPRNTGACDDDTDDEPSDQRGGDSPDVSCASRSGSDVRLAQRSVGRAQPSDVRKSMVRSTR